MHGGVAVEPELGEGSIFHFAIPKEGIEGAVYHKEES